MSRIQSREMVMRYFSSAVLLVLAIFAPSAIQAQGPLTIVNYQLVSEVRLTRSQSFATYTAQLSNNGAALNGVTATVTSLSATVQVVPGQGILHFKPVPANSVVTSGETFTILVDLSFPFDFTSLKWSFVNPLANAGPNQTVAVGSTVILNGSGSSSPSGAGGLSYSWAFAARPSGSTAILANADSVIASFVVDVPGNYILTLTVSNGGAQDSANMTVSTVNSPPVARAGANQTVAIGSTVVLNGGSSSDVDGDPLSYSWILVSRPAASSTQLVSARAVSPTLLADKPGAYVVQLIVNDGKVDSAPSTVTITSGNTPPVANAGTTQVVSPGALVQLSGSGSTDVDGDPLTYNWSLTTVPPGSSARLSGSNTVNPSFTADIAGTYVAQLIVNDGKVDSTASMVLITTNAIPAPTANAGPNQTVVHGATVTLSGSGSDPQGLPLTLAWSLITKPAGSAATLSNASIAHPTFVADMPGAYIAQLIVSNGSLSSAPSNVTVTTTNTPPVANAGANQNVVLGSVSLDGSGSSDADHDPLTYSWSFTSRPPGSSAVLLQTTTTSPVFVADAIGTFVVQLIVNDGFASSAPATVSITTNGAQTISFAPPSLTFAGTETQNLTLTLSGPAPAGGLALNISSNNTGVATVASPVVTIPANATSIVIPVTGVSAGSAVIRASAVQSSSNLADATASITVNAATAGIILPPQMTIAPGSNGPFTINLASPAASSLTVQLVSSDPSKASISVSSVSFNAGQTQPTRQPNITGVAVGTAVLTATAPGFAPATSQITVGVSATLSPPSLTIGAGTDGTLTLNLSSPAQSNLNFTLSSTNSSVAAVPLSAPVPTGTSVVSFKVTGSAAGVATIKASAPGYAETTSTITVQAAGSITLSVPSTSIQITQVTPVTITLSQPAPASGVTVNLTNSAPTKASLSAASVFIPSGATTGTVQLTAINIGSPSIGASAQGYSAATPLVMQVGTTIAWVNPSLTVIGIGQQVLLDLRMFVTVPGNNNFSVLDGIAINVTSSRPDVAVTPSQVNFFWDGSTVPTTRVQLTSVGPGTTILHASGLNIPDVTMTITVTGPLAITTPSLAGGVAGSAYSATVVAAGGTQPYSWSATGLPSGLAINPATGEISGTPAAPGTSSVHVTVVDASAPTPLTASGTFSLPVSAPVPASVAISGGSPQSAVVGTAFSSPLTVLVKDTSNSPAPGATVMFTVTAAGGAGATLSSATAVTAADGSASVNATANTTAGGPYTVAAAVGALTPATFSLTNTPGPAASVTVSSGNNQTTTVNTAFGSTLVVVVKDTNNNPVSGATVNFAVAPASGAGASLSLATVVTNAAGQASITATANSTAGGPFTVTATVGALAPAAFSLTNTAGPAATVAVFSGNNQSAAINAAFGSALVVIVKDGSGNSVSGATVNFTVTPVGGASAALSVATVVTDAAGKASTTATANATVGGPYSVGAAVGALTPAAFSLTNTMGAPASVTVFSGNGQNALVGTSFTAPLIVVVKDGGNNLVSGATVNFTVTPLGGASASLSNTTVITDAIGRATVSATANTTVGGPYTVSAAVGALTPAIFSLTNTAGTPASVTVSSGSGQSTVVSTAFPSQLVALVKDTNNIPMSNVTVTFTVTPVGGAGAALSSATATTAADGTARVTATANATVGGPYTVSATLSALSPAVFSLTNTFGQPASVTVVSGSGQNAVFSSAFASSLVVVVKDGGNNAVPGVTVNFAVTPVGGASASLSSTTAVTNAAGQATITATANATVGGPYTVAATVGALAPANFSLTNTAGPPASVTVTAGDTQSTAVTTAFGSALTVIVKDAGGHPISGSSVNFTVTPVSGAGASLSNATVVTSAAGVASVTATANSTVGGPYTVTATLGALSANFSLTNLAGAPASVTVSSGSGQSTQISTAFGAPLQVLVKDIGNNPVSGVTVTFTVTFAGGAGATLSSPTAITNAAGIASVTATANSILGAYTVAATVNALPSANFSLTNLVGPPASVSVSTGSPQSTQVTTAFPSALVAVVRDSGGNVLPGITVNFAVIPNGAASANLSGASAVTTAAGLASVTATANGSISVGAYTVTATVGALAPANFLLTNTPGSAALVTANSGNNQVTAAGTVFPGALVALVQDAGNNPVAGVTVQFTVTPAGSASATLSSATAISDANGLASVTATANVTMGGPYTVSAKVGALAPATFSLTNTAGPAAKISMVSGSPQGTTVTTAFPSPLQVLVTDINNNPKSGVTVTFTAPSSGATATFAGGNTAPTNASGVATSTAVSAGSLVGGYEVVASVGPGVSVSFLLTNQPGPAALMTISGGTGQTAIINTDFASPLQVTVTDIGGNPIRAIEVTFTAPVGGATGTFAGGMNRAFTDSLGRAFSTVFTANGTSGAYHVIASVPGVPSASFDLTNTGPVGANGTITITSATVGKNLQAPLTITMNPAVPVNGVTLTIQSGNAGLVLLGSGGNVGLQSASASLPEGLVTVSTFAQALADSGTVTITASAPGYAIATATVTLAPSGFVVSGPNGVGAQFSTFQGVTTPVNVTAARLNGSGGYAETQQLRGGFTTAVNVMSSVTTVGDLFVAGFPASSVTFNGGNQAVPIDFVASGVNSGTTDVIVAAPADFSTPTNGTSVNVIVQQSGLIPFAATVGQNLEAPVSVAMTGSATSNIPLTIVSSDPSKMKFSLTSTSQVLDTINVDIPVGHDHSVQFYVQGLSNVGTVGYTVSGPGFTPVNGSVTLASSGLRITSPGGVGAISFAGPAGFGPANLTVSTGRLNTSGVFAETQLVASGHSVSVTVVSSNTSVGTISASPITIAGGSGSASTSLVPVTTGSTTVTMSAPQFTPAQVAAQFTSSNLIVDSGITVGKNLEQSASVILPAPAGAGGVQVTVTVQNASLGKVKLAALATDVGADQIVVTVPKNQSSGQFFVYALLDTGSGSYTASSPGYGPASGTANLATSGIVIQPSAINGSLVTGTATATVFTALLNGSNGPVNPQALAGGAVLNVPVASNHTNIATVPATVAIAPGSNSTTFNIALVATGTANIAVSQPSGYTTPSSLTSASLTVGP